jgi:hypothetical protein
MPAVCILVLVFFFVNCIPFHCPLMYR